MGDRRDKSVQGIKLKLKLPAAGAAAAVSSPANPTSGTPTTVVPPRPKIKLNLGKPTTGATGAAVDSSAEATTQSAAGDGDASDAGLVAKKGELSNVHMEDSIPAKRGRGGSTSARGRRGAKSGQRGRLKVKLQPMAPSHVEIQSSAPVPDSYAASEGDGNGEIGGDDAVAKSGDTSAEGMDVGVPLSSSRAKLEADSALVKETTDDGLVRNVGGDNSVQDATGVETQTPATTEPPPPPAGITSSVTFAIPSRETSTPGRGVAGVPTSTDRDGRSSSVMTTSADAPAPGPTLTTEVDGTASGGGAMTPGLISTSAANSEPGTPGDGLDDDAATIGGTGGAATPAGGTPGPSSSALGTVGAGRVVLQGKNRPYLRTKKPLKEVLKKVLADIRRKDLYGLFLEPVDEQEFPGYLDMIGGRENAMDLATMEDKIDTGRYKTIDQFEADVDKMIRAAQVFNPDDSLVHREAGKIKTLAEKHIVRSRPIVRTPSPSPEPVPMSVGTAAGRRGRGTGRTSTGFGTGGGGTPIDGGTPASGAGGRSVSPSAVGLGGEGLATTAIIDSLPPHQVIPEQMLDFPPNSDLALTVGWYLTGGKRFRSRKEQRAKEKWDGQWREWYTTGDRNLREADDLLDLFSQGFTSRTRPGEMLTTPQTVDWSDESMRASEVWQPAPTYTGFEHEERPPPIPMRPVGHLDYGRYQHLPSGYGYPDTRPVRFERDEFIAKVKLELRPPELGPPAWAAAQWLRPEEDPARYLKALATGEDVAGEAYLRSVDKFVRGAEEGAKRNWTVMREAVDGAGRERKRVKLDSDEEKGQHSPAADLPFALGQSLGEYVSDEWRSGMFNKQAQRTIDLATEAYKLVKQERARPPVVKPDPATPPMTTTNDAIAQAADTHTFELAIMKSLVQDILHKLPLRQEILDWSARGEGLDLAALLHAVQDFSATGPGGGPPSTAAERGKWFTDSLRFTGDMIVQEAKRLEAKYRQGKAQLSSSPSSSSSTDEGKQDGQVEKDAEDLQRLTEIRLNLLGLAKNVPVHELRPMSREEAARLPGAVRNLIKIVDRPSGGGGAVAPG